MRYCTNSPGCEEDHCRCDDEEEQDRLDEIQEDTTSMEEKLKEITEDEVESLIGVEITIKKIN